MGWDVSDIKSAANVLLTGEEAKHTMTAFTELLIRPNSTLETTSPTMVPVLYNKQ